MIFGSPKPISKIPAIGLVLLLALSFANTACEPAVRLTVNNQMNTDLMIITEALDQKGLNMRIRVLGNAPADQDTFLPQSLALMQVVIGWTVILKGEDTSGVILWQKSWLFEDFIELEDVGWKITISPETNQLPG
jgi:hypothetical protein